MIFGGAGGDIIDAGNGSDTVDGGTGADTINGGKGGDTILGGAGTDQLFGGSGKDVLQGGAASDFLTGGKGNDMLSGNIASAPTPDGGFDAFYFKGKFGDDTITDFEIGYDQIVLEGFHKKDVTIVEGATDVTIVVDYKGSQTILVENVAGQFDGHSDIIYA